MNKVFFYRPKLRDLLKIRNSLDFQDFVASQALVQYSKICRVKKKKLGSVLSLGSNQTDAKNLPKFSFEKIVLSNLMDLDEATIKAIDKKDKRISHVNQNLESINAKSQSFDLVFCKESLHHIPRPALGFYEMLRVCKNATLIVEPCETPLGNLLEWLGLATKYEGDPANTTKRKTYQECCHVYRWKRKELVKMLNSYYLESGYELHLMNFWLSNRGGVSGNSLLKILGWIIGLLPFNRGNFMIALIVPGKSLPSEIERV